MDENNKTETTRRKSPVSVQSDRLGDVGVHRDEMYIHEWPLTDVCACVRVQHDHSRLRSHPEGAPHDPLQG